MVSGGRLVGWSVCPVWALSLPPCLASAARGGWAGQGKPISVPLPCVPSEIEINDRLAILKKFERRGRRNPSR